MATSRAIGEAYADNGADLVELGVPFSDPLADGPVIHAAGTAALRAGATLDGTLGVAQTLSLLGNGQAFELLVARPHRERIERGPDAHHDADRPPGDLRGHREAVGARFMYGLNQPPPALRVVVAVGQQEPHRTAGLARNSPEPRKLIGLVVEIAVHAESAGADRAQRRANADKLLGICVARRH